MDIYIYIYTPIYIHTHIYTHIYKYKHTFIDVDVDIDIDMYIYMGTYLSSKSGRRADCDDGVVCRVSDSVVVHGLERHGSWDKRSTGHTHTHTIAEQTTYMNTERARE